MTSPPSTRKDRLRLVVIERGGQFELPPLSGEDVWDEVIVVAQGARECALDLALRVLTRLAALRHWNRSVREAAIVIGNQADDRQRLAVRTSIVRALLAHLARAGRGELVILGVVSGAETITAEPGSFAAASDKMQ